MLSAFLLLIVPPLKSLNLYIAYVKHLGEYPAWSRAGNVAGE